MKVKGTYLAGHFAADVLVAQYDISVDVARGLKATRDNVLVADDIGRRLISEGLAIEVAAAPVADRDNSVIGGKR